MTPMTTIEKTTGKTVSRALKTIVLVAAVAVQATSAEAVSRSVRIACFSDYLANCSAHSVGTPELRKCMRDVGSRLSKRCVNALVAAGEVSQAEVTRRATAAK